MKNFAFGICLLLGSTLAFAHGCPGEMKKIDEKFSSARLTDGQMAQIKELRSRGERLHQEGKHSESMSALAEAKKLLGI